MPLLIGAILFVLALVALIPISMVQRFRVGTSRQRARGWLATVNLAGLILSSLLFLAGAAVTSIWVPDALTYTTAGLGVGCALGIVGLRLTRWEPAIGSLHYTPNRWLVLGITAVVTARVMYGFWRGWQSWRAGLDGGPWFVEAGVAGSMAAGAVVLGYYVAFWVGVRRRFERHAATPIRRL